MYLIMYFNWNTYIGQLDIIVFTEGHKIIMVWLGVKLPTERAKYSLIFRLIYEG